MFSSLPSWHSRKQAYASKASRAAVAGAMARGPGRGQFSRAARSEKKLRTGDLYQSNLTRRGRFSLWRLFQAPGWAGFRKALGGHYGAGIAAFRTLSRTKTGENSCSLSLSLWSRLHADAGSILCTTAPRNVVQAIAPLCTQTCVKRIVTRRLLL